MTGEKGYATEAKKVYNLPQLNHSYNITVLQVDNIYATQGEDSILLKAYLSVEKR